MFDGHRADGVRDKALCLAAACGSRPTGDWRASEARGQAVVPSGRSLILEMRPRRQLKTKFEAACVRLS
jgi:hypothetical protein